MGCDELDDLTNTRNAYSSSPATSVPASPDSSPSPSPLVSVEEWTASKHSDQDAGLSWDIFEGDVLIAADLTQSDAEYLCELRNASIASLAEQINDAKEAFQRIRALVGATDNDPMPCEHYVEMKVASLTSRLEEAEKDLAEKESK